MLLPLHVSSVSRTRGRQERILSKWFRYDNDNDTSNRYIESFRYNIQALAPSKFTLHVMITCTLSTLKEISFTAPVMSLCRALRSVQGAGCARHISAEYNGKTQPACHRFPLGRACRGCLSLKFHNVTTDSRCEATLAAHEAPDRRHRPPAEHKHVFRTHQIKLNRHERTNAPLSIHSDVV